MKAFIITVMLCFLVSFKAFNQNSLDELNVILKHNFENNTLGPYLSAEYKRDWLSPEWNSRQSTTRIVSDASSVINPSKALQMNYPAKSLGPQEGGAQWWINFPQAYNEMYISYDLMFMPGFKFQIGGKLPSVQGGDIAAGSKPNGYNGFTGGLMFKENGEIDFYIYFPDSKVDSYGDSFRWGASYSSKTPFAPSSVVVEYSTGVRPRCTPGEWHNITYRIVMNTVKSSGGGNYDGILEAYFDGKLVTQISHILFRHTTDLGIDCMRIYSFFGGNTDEWRNPIEEWLRVDNVLLYTHKEGTAVPKGNTLSPTSRTINYWRKFSTIGSINNSPVIYAQQFSVNESSFSNNIVGKVAATDADANQTLTYSIVSGNEAGLFSIHPQTGVIKTNTGKIFGPGNITHKLGVKVADNAPTQKTATANITVNLVGSSTTVYIDSQNTDDLLENGSIDHPFDSWNDVPWKEGYTYLQKRGTLSKVDKIVIGANRITLDAYGEGDLPVITSETTTYLLSGFEKTNIKVRNLNIQANNAVSCIYLLGNSSDSIIVDHCLLSAKANAVKVMDGVKLALKYNTISSQNVGVYSTAASNEIFYNIFKNCESAVTIMSDASTAKIYNNVFFDNKESLSVTYAELTMFNNIFYFKTPGQIALKHGTGKLTSDKNIFFPEQNGFISIASVFFNSLSDLQNDMHIDLNSFASDPEFVDILDDNFTLKANSPAINAGKNLNLKNDFQGRSVPAAGITDIGAHEFNGAFEGNNSPSDQHVMTLYPNPSSGAVNVLAELTTDNLQQDPLFSQSELKVVDITGKTLFSKRLENDASSTISESINLEELSNGLYFVVIQFADKILKEKLIINK